MYLNGFHYFVLKANWAQTDLKMLRYMLFPLSNNKHLFTKIKDNKHCCMNENN